MTTSIIIWIIQLLLVPALSPLLVGITRKIKAKLQNRQGASCFQPYRDLWKLFHKNEVMSEDASVIFRFAPYVVFAVTLAIAAGIPLLSSIPIFTGDFLTLIYMLALGTFFLALSGIDTGGAFSGFGSSREMLVASLTEAGLVLSLFALALAAKSTNMGDMATTVSGLSSIAYLPIALAFISFFISLLAESARYPFDNPSTHLELTMIHEAMILEYSGKRLAMMEWASANKYLIFAFLGANLFFPWGLAGTLAPFAIIGSIILSFIKASILAVIVAVIEGSFAKWRLFRLPKLLAGSFILSLIAILLII
ncbi:MAG: NADH-quinone oxidoreductase subunit H [Candidatus Vogelbacteria bacterium]|nr:NADH-quinone oxidoreductase subunit H [Candidatus Vogelbacteria bacterium]